MSVTGERCLLHLEARVIDARGDDEANPCGPADGQAGWGGGCFKRNVHGGPFALRGRRRGKQGKDGKQGQRGKTGGRGRTGGRGPPGMLTLEAKATRGTN